MEFVGFRRPGGDPGNYTLEDYTLDRGPAQSVGMRVTVVALALIRRGFALRIEALPAAARGPVVRVADQEAASRHALGVAETGADEVVLAVPVDQDRGPRD